MRKKLHSVTAFDVILAIIMVLFALPACTRCGIFWRIHWQRRKLANRGAGCVVAKGFEPGCL